jgi:hypothetical protein
MSDFSKLKIVAQAAKRSQGKGEHGCAKLLEKLGDQLATVTAHLAGQAFLSVRIPITARS